MPLALEDSIIGCLLGTAVGDALGLPYESLSPRRARKLFGPPDRYRLLFGRGMVSDDTEHACLVAQSLIASAGVEVRFAREMARRLRRWLLALPAGVGWATLRSCVKLWLGYGPHRSGVFSAGNGPAMRAAILGAATDDPGRLKQLVRISTRITHTDAKAEFGALAVAWAARIASRTDQAGGREFLSTYQSLVGEDAREMIDLLDKAVSSVERGESTMDFAKSLGLSNGVSGYVFHTVPVALHAWLRHPHDFRAAVTSVIECGGDTDSTAAIVGGIVGGAVGRKDIPASCLQGLCEWPRTVRWMERLGRQLAEVIQSGDLQRPVRLAATGVLLRNTLFLCVVLVHGFRRALPPY